jgi:hypothetical protein
MGEPAIRVDVIAALRKRPNVREVNIIDTEWLEIIADGQPNQVLRIRELSSRGMLSDLCRWYQTAMGDFYPKPSKKESDAT